MASNQNQGLQVAVIVFVILTVFSMGFALFSATERRELVNKFQTQAKVARDNEEAFNSVQEELNEVKKMIGLAPIDTGEMPDLAATKAKFEADLKKYGDRLKSVQDDAAPAANYSQSIDAVLTVLENRNIALEAEIAKSVKVAADKAALEATFQAQTDQFKKLAEDADKMKTDAASKIDVAEKAAAEAKKEVIAVGQKGVDDLTQTRAEMQKKIDELEGRYAEAQGTIRTLEERVAKINTDEFAATFDGQITRINPSARTVWINVGTYDNLQKHLTFSVQPQGVPAGSKTKAKAKIEVTQILDNHLAECRIVEDDLNNPILVGDNIYTSLWEPGQQTRFAFAGRIDLDGDGTDGIERVRTLVSRAGGRIDAVAKTNGETDGELTIETRYLVLGRIPADKNGIDAYNRMKAAAENLGVQRVPVEVFLDQIGYRREDPRQRIVFGGGSANAPKVGDAPDGGAPVSNGSVNALFKQRRPPAAAGTSAY